MRGGLAALVAFAARRPLAVLLAALALTMIMGMVAADRAAMTTDATALMSPTVPWRVQEQRMEAAFPGNGDVILAVVDGATPELAEQAAAALTARLTADRAHFTRVRRPDGGPFFAREGLLFQPTAKVSAATAQMIAAQPFLGPLAADPSLRGIAGALGTMVQGVERGDAPLSRIDRPMRALADALDARARGRPAFFSWQALLGSDGMAAPTRRLVLVSPVLDYGALMPGAPAADAIRAATSALRLDAAHGVSVRLTGSVPLSDEEFASLADHAWLVGGAMLAAMLLTLRLATRSWRITAAILATTLAGLVITTGLGLLAVGRLNLISVAFIPLFVGLGVDFGIQLAVRFQAERVAVHDDAHALAAAAEVLGPSLLLAATAVCLGFLAFLPTDYVGIAELGVIAAIGMVIALVLSLTMLPALLVLVRPPQPRADIGVAAMAPLDRWLLRHRRAVLAAFALSLLASIASLALVRFDFDPLHLRNPHGEAMATLADLMRDPDRNPNTIDILAPSLRAAEALAARIERNSDVAHAITAASFVPEDQDAKLALVSDAATLLDTTVAPLVPLPRPADADNVAALSGIAAALRSPGLHGDPRSTADARRLGDAFARLAAGPARNRIAADRMLVPPLQTMLAGVSDALAAQPVTVDTLPPEIRRDWIAADGRARIEVTPTLAASRNNRMLAGFVRAVRRITPDATGPAVSAQAAAQTVARAFIEAGLLALAAVTLLLLAILRDLREVAFTLAPVVLSGFLTLGSCVLIGQPINFANIIAFPLLFGVGTAFHIYFVMAWRNGATDLLQSSLARAVFFSALATGSAFGSLWLSRHPGTASMGKILMISLAWTLVCALIFEPALLGPPRRERGAR